MFPTQQGHWCHAPRKPPPETTAGVQRVFVVEVFADQIDVAEDRVIEGVFVEVGKFGVLVGEIHLVLKEEFGRAGAGLAIRIIAQ